MRKTILSCAIVFCLANTAEAAPRSEACLSYGEAKRVYRGAYLHWRTGTHGRRCWGVSDKRRTGRIRSEPRPERADHILAQAEPPPERWNLLDHPSWAWVAKARLIDQGRFKDDEPQPWTEMVPFSTFAMGEEPDVWPALAKETAAPWWRAAVAGLLGALAAWAVWLVVGGPISRYMRRIVAVGVR